MLKPLWQRIGVAVAAVGLTVATAVGCSSPSTEAAAGGKTTLRVIVNITPNLTEAYWNKLFDSYEKDHPDITVKLELTGTISASAKLTQDLAAGDPPDIAQQITPTTDTAKLFTDLSGQDWVADTPLVDQYAIGGKKYLVGVGEQIQSLVFYNKAAFAKAGLDATKIKTLDDFTAAMARLKEAGYTPMQTAGQWVPGAQFNLISSSGLMTTDPEWMSQRTAGKKSFADSDYVGYLDLYQDWAKKGYLAKSALGLTYADGQNAFLKGKSGMYVMGSFFVPAADAAKKSDKIGVFPMPTDGTYPPNQYANIADPYVVVKQSKHQAAAIDFVRWLVTDKAAVTSQLAADGNLRKGYDYDMSSLGKQVQDILDQAPGRIVAAGSEQPIAGYSTELNKDIQSLYTGSSGQHVAESLDKWWNSQN